MLVQIKDRVLTSIEVYLKFDDNTSKSVVLNVDDFKRITYVKGDRLVTVEGRISNICTNLNLVDRENIIEMDISKKHDSEKVRFLVSQIRDIYTEPEAYNGITYNFLLPKVRKLAYTRIEYGNIIQAYIFFNVGDFIDPNITNMLLDREAEVGENNGSIYLSFNLNIDDDSKYNMANRYSVNYITEDESEEFTNNINGAPHPQMPAYPHYHPYPYIPVPPQEGQFIPMNPESNEINRHRIINIPFFAFKLYYRLSEDDSWIDGSSLPIDGIAGDDISLRQQLSYVLDIDKDKLAKEYGYLFKFEPADTGRIDKYRIDLFKNTGLIGTEYLCINYMSDPDEDDEE